MSDLVYEINGGVAKVLEVYEDHVALVAQKTARAFLTGNLLSGTKEFYYSDLTSIQFKPANYIINGYLQFEYPGSHSGIKTGFGIADNFNSENSFAFMNTKVSNEKMQEVAEYIKEQIKKSKQPQQTTVINETTAADELIKYKQLLDMGAITQEEFDNKKQELLK